VLIDRRCPTNGQATQDEAQENWHVQPVAATHQQVMPANTRTPASDSGVPVAIRSFSSCVELVSGGHAIGRRGCEMRAPILDQPLIAVAARHVEKVDRDRRDDRPIRTLDIVHGKESVGNCDVRFDKADPIVGERRLRGGGYGLLRLGTEVLHHGDSPLQKITHRRHESSIFGE
jgi:hypothetical protein